MPIQKGPANLGTGTIDAAELASGSVTTAKIADANVTSGKLASGAAVSNIGYTPANKAGDTFTGYVEVGNTVRVTSISNPASGSGMELAYDGTQGIIQTYSNRGALTSVPVYFVNGQIKFPASQNASGDANTLDDYEEGTFTPTVSFSMASVGVTYTARPAIYTKIGRTVNFQLNIDLSNKGSSTGYITIGNLPFSNSGSVRANCSVYMSAGIPVGTQIIGTDIYIYKNAGGGSFTNLDSGDVTNTTSFVLAGSYQV